MADKVLDEAITKLMLLLMKMLWTGFITGLFWNLQIRCNFCVIFENIS